MTARNLRRARVVPAEMRLHLTLLSLLAAALVAAAPTPAAAAPLGFEDPLLLASDDTFQTVASVRSGHVAVAWATGDGTVVVARRRADGGVWGVTRIRTDATFVRDVQVAEGPETVVAWAETLPGGRQRISAATAARFARFGSPRVVATVGSAHAATPRLAALGTRTVLVWRDRPPRGRAELRVATKDAGRAWRTPRSLGRDGVGPAVVRTTGDRALLAWATADRRTRGIQVGSLGAGATRPSNVRTVSRSARGGPVLASGLGRRALVSWQSRAGTLLTRRVGATMSTTRRIATPEPAHAAARVTLDGRGEALAVWRAGQFTVYGAAGTPAGAWLSPAPLSGGPAAMVGTGRPVLAPGAGAFVLWQQSRDAPGPVRYDVRVAWRAPGETAFRPAEVLAPGSDQPRDGRGLAVAHDAGVIVVAWPASDGVRVMVRRG